jgi:hypothetical protein
VVPTCICTNGVGGKKWSYRGSYVPRHEDVCEIIGRK